MNTQPKLGRRAATFGMTALAILGLQGCPEEIADAPQMATEIFAAMGEPLPSATDAQLEAFDRGRDVAVRRFTPEEGLGPDFNVTFCAGCHEKPVIGGASPRYRSFQLTVFEASDGTQTMLGVNGVQTQFSLEGLARTVSPEETNLRATRNGVPFFGVGLIAELYEEGILANADPDDANGDGISGRPNWDRGFVGRFGRKAQTVSIEGFIRGPLNNHLGITSNPLTPELQAQLPVPSVAFEKGALGPGEPAGTKRGAQAAAPDEPLFDSDDVADPELGGQDLFDLVSFTMLLAAPKPDAPTEETLAGGQVFDDLGCAGCHTPTLEGPRGLIPLYSDLLLHDMGSELADGFRQGLAMGNEFRTQPLWGVGATGPYLHDGRADTLADAIIAHGGEATRSRLRYQAVTDEERALVGQFLNSLGGADQRSEGLLPPNDPAPAAGEWGGPEYVFEGSELAQFEEGRRLFDRDLSIKAGLGPTFNGDACRSCHFDPVIGGAGPEDLNVTRQAIIDPVTGAFTSPKGGTMVHRHSIHATERPEPDAQANWIELRQTPAIFGLGRLDAIPDAVILAGADPDDENGDGIRGWAHVLPDGRVGRLGWKAQVPSVEEFLRDASAGELGMTVPARVGRSFGITKDYDSAPDPELSGADYDALRFFMENLAQPPGQSVDSVQEAAGAEVFDTIGCASCHTPSLVDTHGDLVWLYSDLLLHDLLPEMAWGVVDGLAGERAFKTPPLWGVSFTGPWMHAGDAYTLSAAILAHASEGAAAREGFVALDGIEKDALIAFLRSL